jgi:hypothetical protein
MALEQKQPTLPAQPREQQPQRSQDDESSFVHIPTGPSSQIDSVNYNPTTLDLIIVFVGRNEYDGATYRYFQVDQPTVDGFKDTPSPGKYFNSAVKGRFEFERLN